MEIAKVFYILYVLSGGGGLNTAWGGPAMLMMPDQKTCEAAAKAIENKQYVFAVACVKVTVPAE